MSPSCTALPSIASIPSLVSKEIKLDDSGSGSGLGSGSGSGSGSLTCTVQVADTEPYVAEILAVPAATAVTRPDSETVANSSASEDHTTSSVVFAGAGVAVSCRVSPTASSFSVQSSTTAVAGTRESPSSSEQAAKAQAANAKSKSFFIVRLILSMFVK